MRDPEKSARYRRPAILLLLAFSASFRVAAQDVPRTVHVFVALADNKNQGIVPVAARLGNGLDAKNNLYWGSAYGVKTFFGRSADWELVAQGQKPKPEVLERCIFKHRRENVFLVADAYQGDKIRQTIFDFLDAAAGANQEKIAVRAGPREIALHGRGGADLVAYIGHEGFMDFQLPALPRAAGKGKRDAIVLACISKTYFRDALRSAGATPLLWTTGLMAPEAYTLKSALDGWILHEDGQAIRTRAAGAYSKYQKCSLGAARKLLVTGW
jgi:hypothetical protein